MNRTPRVLFRRALFGLSAATLPLLYGCSEAEAAVHAQAETSSRATDSSASTAASDSTAGSPVVDHPIDDYKIELLELAFEGVTDFPREPHIKNRSRAQERVVEACFELEQPERALRYVERIDNWRRGAGYAAYAFYCAQRGDMASIEHYLEQALSIAEGRVEELPVTQQWRRDRILATIARTRIVLDQREEVLVPTDMGPYELGSVQELAVQDMGEEDLDAFLARLQEVVLAGDLDQVRASIDVTVRLYDRFYEDAGRREYLEQAIRDSWRPLPLQIQIEILGQLARRALEHGDRSRAIERIDEAQARVDEGTWVLEDWVPHRANLARLRFAAGQEEEARAMARAALDEYQSRRDEIVQMFRAGPLCSLAEAFLALRDRKAAARVYHLAVVEGMDNENARPRANDLARTCCSMALNGFEPDAELWGMLREIRQGLGDPW